MANLTLYRDFYCINHTSFDSDVYTFITPVELSAHTYISGSPLVVETLTVENESVGKYFVRLNPIFYSFDYIYELNWSVVYNTSSPLKILKTRFRMRPYNITAPFDVEIVSQNMIEVELLNNEINIEL